MKNKFKEACSIFGFLMDLKAHRINIEDEDAVRERINEIESKLQSKKQSTEI